MHDIVACRACLATGVKLFTLESCLARHFQAVTSFQVSDNDGRPRYLCYECAARVTNYGGFRDKCLRAESTLEAMLAQQGQITQEQISYYNRAKNGLESTLSLTQMNITDTNDLPVHAVKVESDIDEKTKARSLEPVEVTEDIPSPIYSDDDVPLIDIKAVKRKARLQKSTKRRLRSRLKNPKSKLKTETEETEEIKKRGAFNEDFATEILLTKEQQLDELKERAKTLNYLNSPYKCTMCYKGFVEELAFRNHMKKHDVTSGAHECDVCRMRYESARRLRAHATSSHARMYACRACPHVSHTANQAREHDKWHKGHLYKCRLCGMTFRKPTSHLTHMRKRHPTEFVCGVCGDSFVGRHGLVMHQRKTHDNGPKEERDRSETEQDPERYCTECNVQFDTAEAYRRHTVTSAKHALTNDFGNGCRICGEKCATRAELEVHSKQHAKRSRLKLPASSLTHLQCDQCEAKFINRSKLLAHTRRVHLGVKYNKNIVCELCGKSCTSNATLKYHQRTHTGEKPFQCSECPKRFSDRNQLRIHTRTHTDERPYSCRLCSKTFRQKPALNRHLRVHTGVKPYECSYCGKTFSQSNSLKIHVHTVHLKLPPMYRSRSKLQNTQVLDEKPHEITLQRL